LTGIWERRYTRGFEELRGAQFFHCARAAGKFRNGEMPWKKI
jgi:hypothetical protein